jgi:3-phenylpropionate/trans-cinnamate dioxygenase ferredoxin reductase subunit
MSKYLIIGGGVVGGRACQGIRRGDAEGSVTLIAGEHHVPYQRPPLSKGYLTGKEGLDKVYLKDDAYYAENNVEVIKGVRAAQIDRAARRVLLDDGRALNYEKLLLATGGSALRLPLPGNDLPGVFTLRTIEDADSIRSVAKSAQRALVIGGSFIGSEVAASLAQLGLEVTMVFPESRLLERVVPGELSGYLHNKYSSKRVQILSGTKPTSIEGGGQVQGVNLDNGRMLAVDLVVMGVGIHLNTELPREAGLELGLENAVLVDKFLRTSDPDIYAAGDIAAWPDPTFGKRLRVEHWDVAWQQGMRVGRNMAGQERAYTTMPYFFSDLFDLSFEAWGDLSTWSATVLRGTVESGSFAFYYFSQGKMVGALAVGRPDAERDPMIALVKARLNYDEVAGSLADEQVDLSSLVG